MTVPREAEPLYGLPPERFVAERNQLAKALAAKGDPAADEVRKLARPDRLANALNRLARARPDELRALLDAGERLRKGQRRALSGGGAEALRAAEAEVREAARALRNAAPSALAADGARPLPPALLGELELALRVAATGAEPDRDALRRGVLTRAPERSGFGELAGLAVVGGGARSREAREKTPQTKEIPSPPARVQEGTESARGERVRVRGENREDRVSPRARAQADRERREAERRAQAEREAQLRAEARARDRAAAQARKELAAAEADLRRCTRELESAERRAAEARERKDDAERAVAEARRRLEELTSTT